MALLNEHLRTRMQEKAVAIWVSNCSPDLAPDLVRLMGVRVEPDHEHLTLYVPVPLGRKVIANLTPAATLAFLFAVIHDNTSFQCKGKYVSHRPCTEEEVAFQRRYVQGFCRELTRQGLLDQEAFFKVYFHQPSIALRMRVEEIYEQTPRAGTGGKAIFPKG